MAKYAELFTGGRVVAEQPRKSISSESAPTAGDAAVYTVLFVDDEEGILHALRRVFIEENYNILTADSAEEALEIMASSTVHLVVSDHRMPGMTGAELLRRIKERWPDTIRIMLTGYADVQSIMGAVNEGAVYKFITKPWNDEDLRLTVSLAFQQYALVKENRRLKEVTKKQEAKIKNYSALFDEDRGVFGSILVQEGLLSEEDLARARREALPDEVLSETLDRLGLVSARKGAEVIGKHLKVDMVDLREMQVHQSVAGLLPRDLCEKNRILPIKIDERQITLAMADPSDIFKCDNIAMMTGLKVVPCIAPAGDITAALTRIYGGSGLLPGGEFDDLDGIEPLDEIDIIIEEDEQEVNVQELIGSSGVPPIIRIVNAIISEAIRYKASDIHVEPKTKCTVVRYRIDGMLTSKIRIPPALHPAIVSRIKILSKMDIAERRKPQDGRLTVQSGTRTVDIRVSTMPTINGEKIVMRILDKTAAIKRLDELGVAERDLDKITAVTRRPQGIIISTGPTGSGKTTMLYSILEAMLNNSKNFETIEEPVEYFLEDATQVAVHEKIGLSFASVLRSTLRQDPDVILVGEVRDRETADVAFKAALTGHMVLTTLHTNSSVASITRLIDMGVKPYLIASALECVLAQLLVRTICPECRKEAEPDPATLDYLGLAADQIGDRVFIGTGCSRCNDTGYLGRTGIFEIFMMNDDFRHLISSNYKEGELLDLARAGGMRTLVEDGVEKVRAGITTLDELIRVIGTQSRYERQCSGCDRMIDAKHVYCPYCGAREHDVCGECKTPLENDWNLCPACGTRRENRAREKEV